MPQQCNAMISQATGPHPKPKQRRPSKMLPDFSEQLKRSGKEMLANANCFKASDKAFIYSVIDRNFENREDMVNTIKAFIQSSSSEAFRESISSDDVRRRSSIRRASAADEIEMGNMAAAPGNTSSGTPYHLMEGA